MLTKSAFKDTITRDTFLEKKPIHWNLSTWQVGNIQKLGWVQLVDCYSLVRLALRGLAQFSFFEREGVLVDWLGDWLDNKAGVLVLITSKYKRAWQSVWQICRSWWIDLIHRSGERLPAISSSSELPFLTTCFVKTDPIWNMRMFLPTVPSGPRVRGLPIIFPTLAPHCRTSKSITMSTFLSCNFE